MVVKKYVKEKFNRMYGGGGPDGAPKGTKPKKSIGQRMGAFGSKTLAFVDPKTSLKMLVPGGLEAATGVKTAIQATTGVKVTRRQMAMIAAKTMASSNPTKKAFNLISKKVTNSAKKTGKVLTPNEVKQKAQQILRTVSPLMSGIKVPTMSPVVDALKTRAAAASTTGAADVASVISQLKEKAAPVVDAGTAALKTAAETVQPKLSQIGEELKALRAKALVTGTAAVAAAGTALKQLAPATAAAATTAEPVAPRPLQMVPGSAIPKTVAETTAPAPAIPKGIGSTQISVGNKLRTIFNAEKLIKGKLGGNNAVKTVKNSIGIAKTAGINISKKQIAKRAVLGLTTERIATLVEKQVAKARDKGRVITPEAISALKTKLGGLVAPAAPEVAGIPKTVGAAPVAAVAAPVAVAAGPIPKTVGAAAPVAAAVGQAAQKLVGAVQDAAPRLVGAAQEVAPKLLGAAQEAAQKLPGAAQEVAQKLAGAAQDAAPRLVGAVQDAAQKIAGAAQGAVQEVAPKLPGAPVPEAAQMPKIVGETAPATATEGAKRALTNTRGVGAAAVAGTALPKLPVVAATTAAVSGTAAAVAPGTNSGPKVLTRGARLRAFFSRKPKEPGTNSGPKGPSRMNKLRAFFTKKQKEPGTNSGPKGPSRMNKLRAFFTKKQKEPGTNSGPKGPSRLKRVGASIASGFKTAGSAIKRVFTRKAAPAESSTA